MISKELLFPICVFSCIIGFFVIYVSDGLPILRVDTMAMVLNFFAEVCAEGHMRDWLGSPEGSVFWLPLLSLLCNKSNSSEGGDEGLSR